MLNFVFQNTVKLIFGKGELVKLKDEIPKQARILLTYGQGSIKKYGIFDQIKDILKGYTLFDFGGIEPNPQYDTLMKAVTLAKKEKVDFLLAVGGGSVIDGTKFIAAAMNYKGDDPWKLVTDRDEKETVEKILPIGTVLTIPAAGSEMNYNAVISRGDDKLTFVDPRNYPKFSILDPTFTFTLPKKQTANGIVDAFVHVTEQYLTYPVNSPLQDRFAEGILLTLIEEAPKVMENPNNYEARANIMLAAAMALNNLIRIGVPGDWATHRIGVQLTGLHGLDHGVTLAIILPTLLSIKREVKREKLLQYAERIFGITEGSEEERIDKAIHQTRSFFEFLGIKTYLSNYGISKKDIPALIQKLEQRRVTPLGEKKDITLEVAEKIYEASL